MPPPVQYILDLLRDATPLWLFVLVSGLYFFLGPIRQIMSDRAARADAKTADEIKNKDTISAFVIQGRKMFYEIHDMEFNDSQLRDPDSDGYDEPPNELLNNLHQRLEMIDIYDGSHDNLLRTRMLSGQITGWRDRARTESMRIRAELNRI